MNKENLIKAGERVVKELERNLTTALEIKEEYIFSENKLMTEHYTKMAEDLTNKLTNAKQKLEDLKNERT